MPPTHGFLGSDIAADRRWFSSRSDGTMVAVGFNPRFPNVPRWRASRSDAMMGLMANALATRPQASLRDARMVCGIGPWVETHGYRQGVATRRPQMRRPPAQADRALALVA